jgi:hypothetical protein
MLKLNPKVTINETHSLFQNKYSYKTVIICPAGHWFRGRNIRHAEEMLDSWVRGDLQKHQWHKLKTKDDYQYCVDLVKLFKKMNDYFLRIEQPLLSFYTNDRSQAFSIANLDPIRTKYVSVPPNNTEIEVNQIILKRINYDYKVTVGRTRQNYSNFVAWAKNTGKAKMTKTCEKELQKDYSWGGYYFYVKDDTAMTMVKMFIGSDITRIDKVIKADK